MSLPENVISQALPMATFRASSVSDFLDCSLRWYYKHIEGLSLPSGAAAHLGTSLHHSTAVYDQARLDGEPISADDAAGAFIDRLHHPDEDVDWGDDTPGKLEAAGLSPHTEYCRSIAPARDYTAVELTCNALDVETAHGVLRLTGTTDRVRRHDDGRFGISDIKSGGRAVSAQGVANTSGHAAQLGVYTLLAEYQTGERLEGDAEIIGLQTRGKPRVAAGPVHNPADALVGTGERPGLIETMASMVATGTFPPNPRSMLCSVKFCPAWAKCPFHE